MSDTVKIIIEIPKETKQIFDKTESNNLGIIGRAVKNGIPLDDVKEEIVDKAIKDANGEGFIFLGRLLRIFDNIGKAEKGGKE